ncbi:hypothetical protein KKE19_01545 [Patescibacteria group bacterium]|nr:hypothetical protein [Patescibacteria group bacterium]MBU4274477.1 hypothetical protein [Patescibacteria group bacterium]MBU4367382.1 hypothetical protein [Patescibacteria group bacterium]MBU4461703.1 hypothetical protein [Patescibacteria group bacterium]MCG2700086.1 hypothetical protein [Candidatus Parcubacteria bacterium]
MLNRKNIYIIIGIVVVALAVYGAYSWYSVSSQEQPSNNGIEGETGQEQLEVSGPENNNPVGEEEKPNTNQGGLIICRDLCGDGICLNSVCSDDMNCPCPETPEDCPQDCGQ